VLLSEEELFEHKEAIVEGYVLAKVRGLAKLEAEFLFREAENYGGPYQE
jgi:hypothetical protein